MNLNHSFDEDNKNSTYLNVFGLDTLNFDKINYVNYKYFNKDYEKHEINKDLLKYIMLLTKIF